MSPPTLLSGPSGALTALCLLSSSHFLMLGAFVVGSVRAAGCEAPARPLPSLWPSRLAAPRTLMWAHAQPLVLCPEWRPAERPVPSLTAFSSGSCEGGTWRTGPSAPRGNARPGPTGTQKRWGHGWGRLGDPQWRIWRWSPAHLNTLEGTSLDFLVPEMVKNLPAVQEMGV